MTHTVSQAQTTPPSRRRRWVVRLLVAFVVINLIGLVGSSWYYSDRIDSDALTVHQPGPWPEDLSVTAVDPTAGTITMAAKAGTDASETLTQLRSAKVYGLHWHGGFAQSRGAATASGAALTRTATLLEGTWPSVGAGIGVHSFAWPQGVEAPWTSVTYPGPSGTLSASFAPAKSRAGGTHPAPTTWAIMVHGKGSEPDEFDRMMPTFAAAGIPSLAIHYRGDPEMPAEPSNRYGFGASEWPDLQAAVDYARGHGAQHLVLMGASMGGAIVASWMRHAPAEARSMVTGIVLDSPALSLAETVQWGADQLALPGSIPLPAPVTWGAQRLSSWRFGVDWSAVDYVTDPSWDTVPTLVFHGTDDRTVPITTSREFAAKSSQVTLVEVPGADHVESWNVDPAAYEQHLRSLLVKVAPSDG